MAHRSVGSLLIRRLMRWSDWIIPSMFLIHSHEPHIICFSPHFSLVQSHKIHMLTKLSHR